ncbi:MAG: 4a-hydroxytetrahydrobiopterin dehydratase [Planctomycetes bacterium]|nr:4a-hydroxytetrahydrobiopterin dehydratase [Planctomycetota bacterium]
MNPSNATDQQITEFLKQHPTWELKESKFKKKFQFKNFRHAMHFVNTVAWLAEVQFHHPDIKINYNNVTLSITTHDEGAITDKDFKLIEAIDKL